MFRNRELKVTMDKKEKSQPEAGGYRDDRRIEVKTEAILKKFERVGLKIALCVGGYIILDTWRQVQVAKANNQES